MPLGAQSAPFSSNFELGFPLTPPADSAIERPKFVQNCVFDVPALAHLGLTAQIPLIWQALPHPFGMQGTQGTQGPRQASRPWRVPLTQPELAM